MKSWFLLISVVGAGTHMTAEQGHCMVGEPGCGAAGDIEVGDTEKSDKFLPFRFSHRSHFKDDWDSFIQTYSKWQNGLLKNTKLKCNEYQAVVFTPSAGLGDSANALSAAFLYTIRAGMMFFIDWTPFEWETAFAGPGFEVSYKRMIEKGTLCESSKNLVKLKGHITANHMLAKVRKLNEDISFNAVRFFQTFFMPSPPIQKIIDNVNLPSNTVACVIRTGWDDWQHFLLKHDHHKFPACLIGWRKSGKITDNPILLTSDREDVKKEIKAKLIEAGFKVIMLEDSATHVMQAPESELKVHKTIAEFHLISKCSHALLTASSLFGRTAMQELGGIRDDRIKYLSASDCNKPHKGYYRCANPKYPDFCPLTDTSLEWGEM